MTRRKVHPIYFVALISLIGAFFAHSATMQTSAPTIVHQVGFNPSGVSNNVGYNFETVVVQSTGRVYSGSTGAYGPEVGVINTTATPDSFETTITVPTTGSLNFGLANQTTRLVYFRQNINAASSNIIVIDGRPDGNGQPANTALASINFAEAVQSFVADEGRGLLYVLTNNTSIAPAQARLRVVDVNPASATFHQVVNTYALPAAVQVRALAVNTVTNKVYVAANSSNDRGIYVLDRASGSTQLVRIPGTETRNGLGLVINQSTNLIFATNTVTPNNTSSSLTVIDGATDTVLNSNDTLPGNVNNGQPEERLAVNNITGALYMRLPLVGNPSQGRLVVVDGARYVNGDPNTPNPNFNTVVASLDIGGQSSAGDVFVDESLNRVFVNAFNNKLTYIINGADNSVISAVPSTGIPADIAYDPTTRRLYVANQQNFVQRINEDATSENILTAVGTSAGVVNPFNHLFYMGHTTDNVGVLNFDQDGTQGSVSGFPGGGAGTIPAVAVSHSTGRVYAINSSSNIAGNNFAPGHVSVIDPNTNSVVASVETGDQPFGIAINQLTNKIYVANAGSPGPGSLVVIDGATSTLTTINDTAIKSLNASNTFPSYLNPVVNEATNKIYVQMGNIQDGSNQTRPVGVIDGATHSATALPTSITLVETSPGVNTRATITGIRVNKTLNRVYLGLRINASNYLRVLDGATDAVITTLNLPNGATFMGLAVNDITGKIFVTIFDTDAVTVVDGATNTVAGTIPVGDGPSAITVNAAANRIYVGNQISKTISFINGQTLSVTDTLTVPYNPTTIDFDPTTTRVYANTVGSGGAEQAGLVIISDPASAGVPQANLSVTNTESADPSSPGNNLIYTVQVSNQGPSSATNVILTTTLTGSSFNFVSASSTAGSCNQSNGVVTCNIGDMANGASATVTIVVTPTTNGTITSNASVAGAEDDPVAANNTALQTTTIAVGNVFMVTNTNDSGPGSLRDALAAADADQSMDTINFNISPGGVQTITPLSQLSVNSPVFIDGTSQPGFVDKPIIILSGASGVQMSGLNFSNGNGHVRGLVINGFFYAGISTNGGNTVIEGNFIGTDASGNVAVPNGSGIDINAGANNLIGGTTPSARNVISGNRGNNIGVQATATGTKIKGNYIGLNADGTGALPQPSWSPGIGLYSTSGAIIGGTETGAGNVISGNKGPGIWIATTWPTGPGAVNNTVQGNFIGTTPDGNNALINEGGGIGIVAGSNNNLIGGTNPAARNVIAHGVNLDNATANHIQGNYIGIKADGSGAIINTGWAGVQLRGSSGNFIGGTAAGAGNVISGNNGPGIWIVNTCTECTPAQAHVPSTGNYVQGNLIGTNPAGTAPVPNNGNGIGLERGSTGNLIGGASSSARNLISGNMGEGINIHNWEYSANNNTIQGNYIGTDFTGTSQLRNMQSGIGLYGVSGTQIIGNLITGNNAHGISLGAGNPGPAQNSPTVGTTNTTIQGNYIGTNLNGVGPVNGVKDFDDWSVNPMVRRTNAPTRGNGSGGITINSSSGNIIGGTTPATRNIISGNDGPAIYIARAWNNQGGSNNNTIRGNYIGVDIGGNALANNNNGIGIYGGSSSNLIGGDDDDDGAADGFVNARNVISGNTGDGINIGNWEGVTNANTIQGNYIGVKPDGLTAMPNQWNGLSLYGSTNNVVAGNVISGNLQSGINMGSASPGPNLPMVTATGNQVLGNFIGTSYNGTAAIGNVTGIHLGGGATSNIIGGTTSATRNIISGNNGDGINFNGANGNTIQGNYLGTNAAGNAALPNATTNIHLYQSSNNQIGGTAQGAGNVISGSFNGNGIMLNMNTPANGPAIASNGNVIQGNFIGTNFDGTAAIGNKFSGIIFNGASNNTIGGTQPGARNVISGNQSNGITMNIVYANNTAYGSNNNIVQGNLIGTNAAGTAAFPNNGGININGSSNNQIGGTTPEARNVISGNTNNGVNINLNFVPFGNSPTTVIDATGNTVQGNFIGVKADGTSALPNTVQGVNIGGSSNTIGGPAAGAGNVIAFNGSYGVVVFCPASAGNLIRKCGVGNSILGNSIHSNSIQGIVFGTNAGATPSTANANQAAPVLNFSMSSGGNTSAHGTLLSTPGTEFRLEFFANDSCDSSGTGEGQTFVGTTQVTTDASGNASFSTSSLTGSLTNKILTATATHPTNGTSRFSQCLRISPATSSITGRLTDEGSPVSNATITLSGGQSATTTTDANGSYSFAGLASDASYTVSASISGKVFSPADWAFDKLRGDQIANFTVLRVRYAITDLGTLGGTNSFGIGLNESGHVVGRSQMLGNIITHGFLYNGSLPLIDLGTFGGNNSDVRAINDSGKVVGDANATAAPLNRAFVYFNGTKTEVGTFGGNSFGRAINNAGQVAGYADLPNNGGARAFRTNTSGVLNPATDNLGTLPGGTFSQGLGINEAGHVVGISGITGGFSRAFLHNGTTMVDLGTLGGNNSLAFYVNDADMVVGRAEFAPGNTATRAALYSNGTVTDLGTLGGINSSANAINNSNVIVGHSEFNSGNQLPFIQAFIYKDGAIVNLNARIPANSGWNLTTAQSINDAGQIAGYGVINGQTHAFLLTPIAETKTEQTVTFNPLANKVYGNAPFTLSASATSGLPVTFSIVNGPATISGNMLTITGAGIVTVRATQAGDATYNSATADQSFTVQPALLKVIADSKTKIYGAPNPQLTAHFVGFVNNDTSSVLGGALSLNTSANATSPVGTYSITPGGLAATNYTIQYLNALLTVEKASTTATSANYALEIPGTVNLTAQVLADAPSTQPVSGGNVTFVIRQGTTNVATLAPAAVTNGQATASFNVVNAGAYTVYASYSGDTNFFGSTGLASLTVGNANPVPTITGVAPDSTVKKETETGQFTLVIDGNGFMSTTGGFTANSSVDWFDRTTAQHTPLVVTSITDTQIQAVVPYTLIRAGKTVEVSVVNPGPGGGTSNVQPFFITDTTATVTSAETAIPDPVTGTASTSSVTSTGAVLTAEASSGGTAGTGTLTVAQYSADPIGTNASPDTSAFSTADGSGYFDVYVAPGSSFTQLSLDYCNTGGTTLYWWDGTAWNLVSNQSYSPVTQCITVTVTETSSPSIAQLTGTVFGVASGPAVSQITVNPSTAMPVGNANVALSAAFTDAGAPEGATYTAQIAWGDGQTSTCTQGTQPCAVNGATVTGTHAYAAAGVYVIKVKVTRDQDGLYGSSLYESVVVYNPMGAITGGGWFNSPVGALISNPSYTGKVHFNVNASYAGGGGNPTGMVDVRLPGLDLRATSLQWLSVTGNRAQVSGTGTLNGAAGYGFLITATDGKLESIKASDKVRIKVWKAATGEIVFDNQMDVADGASPVIALGGGSVNVKK